MKITLNGTKVRAFKGVDKQGRRYEFTTLRGRTEDGPVRVIFNNRYIYEAVAKATTSILDTVEVEAESESVHKRTFVGRDGKTVTVIETVDPTPVGLTKSNFPTTEKWPDWETLMAEASAGAPASTDAPADSEAEF